MKKFGIIVLAIFTLSACTEPSKNQESNGKETPKKVEKKKKQAPEDPLYAAGKKNYQTYCMTCHMKDGYGVPNLNPPLGETEWVTGDEETLIEIVLNGRTGEIEVNGDIYNGVMIPHSHLSDKEIASILTYIRSSFGNKSGPISEEQVATVRAKL